MHLLRWHPLPTDKLSKLDGRYKFALYGDTMIRLTRRIRLAAPFIGLSIAAVVAFIAYMTADWVYFAMLLGFVAYMHLAVSKPHVPWSCDYRAPLLVLRSFTEERTKLGDEFPPLEFPGAGGVERNPYIWQLGEALWDCCRVILFGDEQNRAQLDVFCIVIKGDDNWQDAVLRIARSSLAIIFFPATTPSCLHELVLLRDSGLLDKTIMVMPPTEWRGITRIIGTVLGDGLLERANHAESWGSLKNQMSSYGFNFPPYDAGGQFYIPAKDFSPRKVIKLNYSLNWDKLFQAVPGPGILEKSLLELLRGSYAFENDRRDYDTAYFTPF